jgi:arginyl-tRNA synthetase
MNSQLILSISQASGLGPEIVQKNLGSPKTLAQGDFAFPCFIIAKSKGIDPHKAALELSQALTLPGNIERFEVVGPYINFFRNKADLVNSVLKHGQGVLISEDSKLSLSKQTVIIEYSSPNIAKPFHVGHLRTTLIGHSLDKIYRFLGYNVISINHLGDWGTQFGFVYAGCQLWGQPKQATIFELVELYIKATTLRKAQEAKAVPAEDLTKPEVNELAKDYFRKLEANDSEAVEFWEWCLDISMQYLNQLYARLGVHFDFFTGESFYRDKLEAVESLLKQSGVLENSEGALGVDLGKDLGFVRVFSEDGRSLYITRDLATADYRVKTFNPEKILYVVGDPQRHYFKQLIAVLDKVNHPAAKKMTHVSYGNVPGISTRASKGAEDRIWLDALVNEAHARAKEAYQHQVEKRPAEVDETIVAESVGLGAVFFNYLCRSNAKEFNFSWEEALNFQGDTGPYIQYAVARLNSIIQKASEQGLSLNAEFDSSHLVDENAYRIIVQLSKFSEAVEKAAHTYEPYYIANLILDIARAFSEGYKSLRVLGQEKELAQARLALFIKTRDVLCNGLALLGVPSVDRM